MHFYLVLTKEWPCFINTAVFYFYSIVDVTKIVYGSGTVLLLNALQPKYCDRTLLKYRCIRAFGRKESTPAIGLCVHERTADLLGLANKRPTLPNNPLETNKVRDRVHVDLSDTRGSSHGIQNRYYKPVG